MEEFFTSRSGHLCLKVNGISFHSSYDPVKEAERFLESHLSQPPANLILLGSGLGYLDKMALQKYVHCRVLSIHTSDTYIHKAQLDDLISERYAIWTPSNSNSVEQFLSRHLSEMDLEGLEVLVWPAGHQIDDQYAVLLQRVTAFVKQLQGSFFSLSHFGWRWINNTLKNFSIWEQQWNLPQVDTVVVAASGPSLNTTMSLLQERRSHFYLIALPSSLAALHEHNLLPDLTVMTDGGYYAGQHLQFLDQNSTVAMPLIASFDPHHRHFLFTFNSYFEQVLLKDLSIFHLPWNGTVAANALMLANLISRGKIILAGQDFAPEGLHLHTEPHTFSPIYYEHSFRIQPFLDFYQKNIWQSRESLAIYAQWFQNRTWPNNIYRLFPSSVPLPFAEITSQEFVKLKSTKTGQNEVPAQPLLTAAQRDDRIKRLIHSFIRQFEQEYQAPSCSDMWLYIDTVGLYQYNKVKRLGLDAEKARQKLCEKVEHRIEILRRQWLS